MLLGILPVLIFLAVLVLLDSYKLVRLSWVLLALGAGMLTALACYGLNTTLLRALQVELPVYSRYGSPVLEELAKFSLLFFLIRTRRVGFMVDAAIFGFAVGTGFAVAENLYYHLARPDLALVAWVIRGLGTAVMHGGATAAGGIWSKSLADRHGADRLSVYLPGLFLAMVLHSFFNHFFISPMLSTAVILICFPVIIGLVYTESERALEEWLGTGLDADVTLLKLIRAGHFAETNAGMYLRSLWTRFPSLVVADMVCYLRLYVELSIRAKGILLLRKTGFAVAPDPEIKAKFAELEFLEKSIGRTGRLALTPLLRTSGQDLWQLNLVEKG